MVVTLGQVGRCLFVVGGEDEALLVLRLKQGDSGAFDVVYERYRARLFGFLARLTRKRDLAEDLLQETWLRLARHAHRLDDDTRLGPWLYKVARNLYLSHRRWVLIDLDRMTSLAPPKGLAADPLTPFDLSSAHQTQLRLEQALLGLPLKYREVVLLVAVEGLTPAEAAGVLELSGNAVRQRLKRGRAMIEEVLAEPAAVAHEGSPA